MFTAAEFRLIKNICPEKLDALLENLGIKKDDFNGNNEFRIYEKLDDEIVKRVCQLMKSESIIDGYTKLMTLGGVQFNYSETDNELLAKILAENEKIKIGLNSIPEEIVQPPEDISEEYDYSNVNIAFSRADFQKSFSSFGENILELRNRKILSSVPQDLKNKIKNLICDYFREQERYNVIEDIEISMTTRNGTYNKKFSAPQKISVRPSRPPLSQSELEEIIKSLNLINDIVKSID